ncbi:MAG: low molecular weight phosphatase family protein [Actinomycetota bacterium]
MSRPDTRPHVVFLCRSNRGKSRMAGAIGIHAHDGWVVRTAGTHPAAPDVGPNAESVAALADVGVPMPAQAPRGLDPHELAGADRVVLLGTPSDDQWDALAAAGLDRDAVTAWETVEPSLDGIEGTERMAMIRDDITARVARLHAELVIG